MIPLRITGSLHDRSFLLTTSTSIWQEIAVTRKTHRGSKFEKFTWEFGVKFSQQVGTCLLTKGFAWFTVKSCASFTRICNSPLVREETDPLLDESMGTNLIARNRVPRHSLLIDSSSSFICKKKCRKSHIRAGTQQHENGIHTKGTKWKKRHAMMDAE